MADPTGVAPTPAGATHTVVAQVAARAVSLAAVVGSIGIVARQVGTDYVEWGTVASMVALVAIALDPGISPMVVRRISQSPEQAPAPSALVPLRLALGALALLVVVAVTIGLRGTGTALLAVALGAQVVRGRWCSTRPPGCRSTSASTDRRRWRR